MKKIEIHSCTECFYADKRFTNVFCGLLSSILKRPNKINTEYIGRKIHVNCPLKDA